MRSWKHTKIKGEIMQYIIPDKVYNILKWVGLVAIPAIGTVGHAVEWAPTTIVVTVITAAGTLVGALLGVTTATAKPTSE